MRYNSFIFNQVVYLNADKNDSFNRDLFQGIANASSYFTDDKISCKYQFTNSKKEFKDYLGEVKENIKNGIFPLIHLSCHGSERGILLPSGGRVKWNELSRILRSINIASRNNLMIVLACCEGKYMTLPLANSMVNDGIDVCSPVYGFIGVDGIIKNSDIENGFQNFYNEVFESFRDSTLDFDKAIQLLTNSVSCNIIVESCKSLFEKTVQLLMFEYAQKMSSNINLDNHIMNLQMRRFRETGIVPNNIDQNKLRNNFMSENFYIDFLNEKMKKYFMIDVYPEIEDRFESIKSIPNWSEVIKNVS